MSAGIPAGGGRTAQPLPARGLGGPERPATGAAATHAHAHTRPIGHGDTPAQAIVPARPSPGGAARTGPLSPAGSGAT